MSTTIDNRVVEMRFDNKQFESATATSMSTIDKLKQKLNFTGAAKGLEDVSAATKKIDMTGLGNAVEAVRVKFSSLQVIGVTALSNIANSAVNAGKRIVSALTLDPIMTGFQEYETQINAVQTILANTQSKGSTLSDVSAALDELNKYADQTIYNFTEMTRNIGTFTAAGVDLDKSVTSIKGIANLAAVSGSNATQASTAMYQLSQALAAGRVSLMDWNSVVNAGMGGEVFQTALKRTAEQMGTNVDALIEKYGSFRESLTEGQWLTAEVLTETLTQLSGAYTEADLIAQGYTKEQAKDIVELANTAVSAATDVKTFTQLFDTLKESAQSGWTETWEILVGDFEESKALLSELSQTFGDIITSSAESRNQLLYDTMTSNWKKITDGITDAGISVDDFKDKVTEVAKSQGVDVEAMVKDYGSLEAAFKNGAISSDVLSTALTKMTGTSSEIQKKVSDLGLALDDTDATYKKLVDSGMSYAEAQDLVKQSTMDQMASLSELSDEQLLSIGYTADQIQSIRDLSNNYELANGSLQTFIDNVSKPMGREMLIDVLRVSLRSLIDIFGAVGQAWRDVFPPTTSDQLLGIIENIRNFVLELRPTESTLNKIQSTFRGLFSVLSIGKQAISAVLSPIGSMVGNFFELGGSVLDVTASFGEWLYALDQSIKAGDSFSSISDTITTVLDGIFDAIHSVISGVGGFSGALDSVGEVVSKVFNGIKEVVSSVAGWIRDNITAGDIFAGLAGGGIFALAKKLSGVVDKIKDIFENFGKNDSIGKFSEILGGVHDSLESFQQGIKVASLVGIAAAVTMLTSSLRQISELKPAEIAVSLTTIRLMIASLTSGFKSMAKTISRFNTSGVVKASIAMMGVATAINILAAALEKIGALSFTEIVKGLIGMAGAMVGLSLSFKSISKNDAVNLRTSIAILAIAQACKMLSEALQAFSALSWEEITRGLTAMGGALLELSGTMAILSRVGGGGSLLGSLSILVAVQSLEDMAAGLKRLGSLSWEEIGKGLTTMGIALGEFTAALGILSKIGGFGSLLGGTAILIAVQSLDEIGAALKQLGQMGWEEIGKGLTAMGGALAEVSVAVGALGKLAGFSGLVGAGSILIAVQGLQDIATALQSFGSMSWGEIGAGLTAMGGALAELAVVTGALGKLAGFSGLVGAGTIVLAVQGLGELADALQKFGSMSWDEIGQGLVGMGGALAEVAVISGLTGTLAGFAGLVGAGTILLASQGLTQLADAFQKFGSMSWDEIGRGLTAMGAAMGETALGGLLNTFSGFGAAAIAEMAEPLGQLADSIRKWEGVTVPEDLGTQIGSLSSGIASFNFAGWGADAIGAIATPIGTLADSIRKWTGVSVPEGLGTQLSSLASGVGAFNFAGWGADTMSTAATSIGQMADGVAKWSGITIPENLGPSLQSLASGVSAFNFSAIGGWSMSTIVEPLSQLADTMSKWSGITIPENIGDTLHSLADGVGAFSWSFTSGWSLSGIVEPLANLADSVKKWNGVNISGIGSGLTDLASGIKTLGEVSVKSIVNEFDGAAEKVSSSLSNMISSATSTISSKGGEISKAFGQIMTDSMKAITDKQAEIVSAAETMMTQFSNAITSNASTVVTAFNTMMSQAVNSVRAKYSDFVSAGSYIVQGLANGIRSNMSAAVAQARAMAQAVEAASKTSLGVQSPSKVFTEIGKFVVMGLENGIAKRTPTAERVTRNLGNALVTTFDTVLGIHSPSVVMTEKGHYVVQGLAEGIESDTSAEEAMKQKAQNIVDAFQTEIDSLSSSLNTSNLEYQLWEALNPNASKAEKSAKEFEFKQKELESQMQTVSLTQAKYQSMVDNFGASSEEAKDAYDEVLQAQIDLANLVTELNELRASTIESNMEAAYKYAETFNNLSSKADQLGMTVEEIRDAAAQISGYNPNANLMHSLDVKQVVEDAISGIQVTYENAANAIQAPLTATSEQIGSTMATALSDSLEAETPKVAENASGMAETCAEKIEEEKPSWEEGASVLVDAFILGIDNNVARAATAAAQMAMQAYQAAMSAIGMGSEKEIVKTGSSIEKTISNSVSSGVSKGASSGSSSIKTGVSALGTAAALGIGTAISAISTVLSEGIDSEPVIKPVLDLTDVKNGVSKLNTMVSSSKASSISTSMSSDKTESGQNGAKSSDSGSSTTFIQNNYSPKALSRVEVYRQTKNLLSTSGKKVKA